MAFSLAEHANRYPFLRIALCWITGMGIASALPMPPLLWVVSLVAALGGLLLSLRPRGPRTATWASVLFHLACLAAGAARYDAHHESRIVRWDAAPHTYRAVVTDEPHVGERSVRWSLFLIDSVSGNRSTPVGRRIQLTTLRSEAALGVQPGDALLFRARIEHLQNRGNPGEFDYAAYLRRRGVDGRAFAGNGHWQRWTGSSLTHRLPTGERLRLLAQSSRAYLVERLAAAGSGHDQETAVLIALTLGDKQALTRETRDLYSQTGVSHVLALSGLHLSILYFFLQMLLSGFRPSGRPRWWREAAIVLFIWSYVWLADAPISLIRAAVMYSLLSLGRLTWSALPSLNNLAIAAFLILLWNPAALHDVGFQLSFLAVAAILTGMPLCFRLANPRHALLRRLWSAVCVSCCAQVGTAPLVAFYFHQFPVWFLLTNLVVVPLVGVLVVGGFVFYAFTLLGLPEPLLTLPATLLSALTAGLNAFLEFVRALPCAIVALYPDRLTLWLSYGVLVAGVLFLASRQRPYRVACLALLALAVGWNLRPTSFTPGIWFYNEPGGALVHFVRSRQESYLWSNERERMEEATYYLQKNHWDPEGITPPRWWETADTTAVRAVQGIVSFGHLRGALLTDATWIGRTAAKPLPVDFLYVGKRFYAPPEATAPLFAPRTVVLESTLGERAVAAWRAFAREHRLRLHVMADDGAFFLPQPTSGH